MTEPVVRNRLFPFFETLIQQGYKVRCVCPQSDFSTEQLPEGVTLDCVGIDFVKPNSFVKRAIKEARDVASLLKHAGKLSSDVFLVTLPSMFLAFFAPYYLRKRKVVMDVRDLSWEYLSDTSLVQRLAKRFFRLLFKRSAHFFPLITATNSTEVDYLQRITDKQKLLHVSNGIRREQFSELKKITGSKEQRFTVSYIGNMGLAQQLTTLVEAARELPAIQFNLVGAGIDEPRIKDLIQKYKLQNITLTGRVTWQKMLFYYNASHVLYAQLAPEYSGAMPSKLYEYLSTGKAIVYGGQGQAVKTLNEFENCFVVSPCNTSALVTLLIRLQSAPGDLQLSESNQTKIEECYIREDAAKLMVAETDKLIEPKLNW